MITTRGIDSSDGGGCDMVVDGKTGGKYLFTEEEKEMKRYLISHIHHQTISHHP